MQSSLIGGPQKERTTNMKTIRSIIRLAVCLVSALAGLNHAKAATFADNFESPTLDPFWSTNLTAGSVTFPSTGQAHGGAQSVKFNLAATVQNYLFCISPLL